MINYITFNNCDEKFNQYNFIADEKTIEICASSLGGFCDFFDNGNGRRVSTNETELTVSTNLIINDIDFSFSRCYTNDRLDTQKLDKKQDICKYAKKISKIINKDDSIKLPLIAYYNNEIEFESIKVDFFEIESFSDRSYGYKNCLIANKHFNITQKTFAIGEYIYFQSKENNIVFYKEWNKIKKILLNEIKKINFDNIFYDVIKMEIMLKRKNEFVSLNSLSENKKIYIITILDILMRSFILNKSIDKVSGYVFITYNYNYLKNNLISFIKKYYKQVQLFIIDN